MKITDVPTRESFPLPLSPAGGPMVGGEGILELDDDLLIRLWPADRVLVSIIFLCMAYRATSTGEYHLSLHSVQGDLENKHRDLSER